MNNQVDSGFWSRRKVLITGHTGFKGSWLSLWLKHLGSQVIGVSEGQLGAPSHFELAGLEKLIDGHYECDVCDFTKLSGIVERERPEIIFHLAAQSLVRPSFDEPLTTFGTNVMGVANIHEAFRRISEARLIVNVTSDKCYANTDQQTPFVETDAMGGHDPYSASKGCAELVFSAYNKSFLVKEGKLGVSVRAGNVIGGGDWAKDRLIPDCVRAGVAKEPIVIRSPQSTRPWQHVLDPLAGYLILAQKKWTNPEQIGEAWNFGPEESMSVQSIVGKFCEQWGDGLESRFEADRNNLAEARVLMLDCSKAKAQLGWRAKLSAEEAIEWTVAWYKNWCTENKPVVDESLAQIERYMNYE